MSLDFLNQTDHRPYPKPDGPWIMRQTWSNLLFAHWPIPYDDLRRVVPAPLELDTYDGQAWIGVVPFSMSNVAARFVPPVPWLSFFPELNVRTYVRLPGHPPGVWFFSLDAGNPVAVQLARLGFFLPYYDAQMSERRVGEEIHYVSYRTHHGAPPANLIARYRPTGPVFNAARGSLEDWLTARYCLYSRDLRGHIYRGEIHHDPWPLQNAEAEFELNTMTEPDGLRLPALPPHLLFARRLDVVVWPLARDT